MAIASFPHADQSVNEPEWRTFARQFQPSGVVLGIGSELEVVADTGLILDVSDGSAYLDGFSYVGTDPAPVTLEPADTTDDRIDLVVLRYNPNGSGAGVGSVRAGVVTGTPAPVPTIPALTEDATGIYEIPLASVLVEANSATAGTVTDLRRFVLAVRDLQGTTVERDALVPVVGQYWYNTDLSLLQRWDGSQWETIGAPGALGDLTDVAVAAPNNQDVLQFDSGAGEWVAADIAAQLAAAVQDAEDAAAAAEGAAILFAIALGG